MSLLQPIIVNKYLKTLNNSEVENAWLLFKKHFHDPEIQSNIKENKEENYQYGFLLDLFVNVFGYTLNPQSNYNLTTEYKNEVGSKKADGAILKNGNAIGVIELKGAKLKDLNKIADQAFNYKNNQKNCRYVITSTFEKLRFYIDHAVDYVEFNLFEITRDEFSYLYLLLNVNSILSDLPIKIKNESVSQEEAISFKLYNDYSLFKRELFSDLVEKNPQIDQLELFKKSQKLLDRFLFIFFCEDRGLLPPNFGVNILLEWENVRKLKIFMPLYDKFKQYFTFLNTGYKDESLEIFAYNGGLFKPDSLLDNLLISDHILYDHIKKISDYDFGSEVDVNILGHIFENSLNEIDEVKAKLNGDEFEKEDTKRKKDGVFYTPRYITKYVIQSTLGRLCDKKKSELNISDENYEYVKIPAKTAKTYNKIFSQQMQKLKALESYREWLLSVTICDPACGSGAFLNEALNYLIAEHEYIDELTSRMSNSSFIFPDIENSILEKNLFGVDINEESVEIARLSLWLRTAKPLRKLNNLSSNIVQGNSLIDDPNIAGENAFDWVEKFPHVFANGGFDIIIGNPPYVRMQGLQKSYPRMVEYYNKNYISATSNYDIYVLFMEKSLQLINSQGVVSYILPHKFLITDFGVGIRKFLAENRAIESILHFGSELVFADASTYTCIINLDRQQKEKILFKKINPVEISQSFEWDRMDYTLLSSNNWDLQSEKVFQVIEKIKEQPYRVGDVFDKIYQGIASGGDKFFVLKLININNNIGLFYSEMLDQNVEIEMQFVKPLIKGNQVSKYKKPVVTNYILFPYKINDGKATPISFDYIENNFPLAAKYYRLNENFLRGREKRRFNNDKDWFVFSRSQGVSNVENPKIMTQEISLGCNMTYDADGEFYHSTTVYSFVKNDKFNVDDKFYLSILNSNLMWFFLKNTGTELSGGFFRFKTNYLKPFPLPEIPENFQKFIDKVDVMLSLYKEVNVLESKFLRVIERKFEINEFSKLLQNWYALSFKEFVGELNKKKIKLSLTEEVEWEEFFLIEKEKVSKLSEKINKTDSEINIMVYKLYGLNAKQIKIVEES